MAPMVATAAEAKWFTDLAHEHGLPVAGAMVEIPAAALRAADLLEHADFLSIGTNDLAQYTLAADRMAGELADLLDPWQPALLDLIRMTAEAGLAAGKSVGVCGEAAASPALAPVLVGLGVTSLSMSASAVADVRDALAAVTLAECREMATDALAGRRTRLIRKTAVDAGSSAPRGRPPRRLSSSARAACERRSVNVGHSLHPGIDSRTGASVRGFGSTFGSARSLRLDRSPARPARPARAFGSARFGPSHRSALGPASGGRWSAVRPEPSPASARAAIGVAIGARSRSAILAARRSFAQPARPPLVGSLLVETGRDQGDEDILAGSPTHARAEDDVRIRVGTCPDLLGRGAHLAQAAGPADRRC